jgi:hydrogenase maturation protease
MKKIMVMAVGNVLTGDDGVGPCALEALDAGWDFPENVTLFDVGTPGIDLTMFMDGHDAVIIIDAISAKGEAGTVRCYGRDVLLAGKLPVVMSPHEPTIKEALLRLDMMGRCPAHAMLVGIIPERLTTGIGLTDAVRAALPAVLERVITELQWLGAEPTKKAEPRAPKFWWESAPEAAHMEG